MEKNELIQAINQLNENVLKLVMPNIQEIIEKHVSDSEKYEKINKIEDVHGGVGFYMIFSDCKEFTQNGCDLTYEDSKFYCVYRGHSYHVRERISSHLFYSPGNKYPNCMKIVINDKKYNINIEEKELYEDKTVANVTFPNCQWIIVKIPLDNSKQAIREMFEQAFDSKYGRPIFSDK